MRGKHRKSRYDSSSSSDSDTSDSSSLESSDSEVPFVLNHSHRHKSQHRIKKSKHKKNRKHKKYRRYRSSTSDSSESCEHKHKKHKHYGSKHHKKQKHHTNSNPNRTDDKERHGDRNFDDWYYQDRIAYHSERDKFDDRYCCRDQGSYDRSPKADSYDRYSHAIDRHYDRYRDRDRYYGRDIYDRGRHFADHSHDETVGYHSEHQVNSKYKRELRHVPTKLCFQPQHFVDHPDYPVYHTNYQYAEPTLSAPSRNPDLIKDVVSNQQMINYHVLTSPVYLGPYHQSDSMSSNYNHVGSTPMASFQGVSYQADGSRSSYFSSPMSYVDYPSQTDGTMITTPSADVVCGTTSSSQEQVSMDYHDSHVSSSPVSATASYIYTNDHLKFDSQSTSVQSENLHSHEHFSIHEEKCNLEYKKGCSDSNPSTTDISSNNADNSLHATSSEYSTLANRMYEFPQQMKITTGNGLQLATKSPKEKLVQMFDELQKELNEKFKEMHDNIAQLMKMQEAEKHKANQLQKNIISGNDDAADNILFPLTTFGSDVSKPNQLEQDMNLSNVDTKSLSLNETLDATQSIVSTSSTSDCSQSEEVLAKTLSLSSETDCSQSAEDIVFPHPNPGSIKSDHSLNADPEYSLSSSIQLTEEDDVCSQPADSCQLNIHLPGLNDTDSLSSATIDVQNMDLPQSTSELKEIDMTNATVECELFEHDSISLPNQIPDIDISVIATSTPKPLSKILQEVSVRCKKKAERTTQLPDIQINSSHSDTLGSLSIQNEITQTDSKLSTTSENISNQVKQLCLEPEPDLSLHSTFEDSIWPIIETTTDATLN